MIDIGQHHYQISVGNLYYIKDIYMTEKKNNINIKFFKSIILPKLNSCQEPGKTYIYMH